MNSRFYAQLGKMMGQLSSLEVVTSKDESLGHRKLGQDSETEFKRITSPLKYQTRCLAAFPDQQGCLVGSIEGRVGVHHLDDSQQSKNFTFKCHREGNEIYSVNSLNFRPLSLPLDWYSWFRWSRHMERLQMRDLMVPSTFGTKIANSGLRQCQDAASPYLAAHSTMMAQSMHMWFVMIGVRVQKITIHQLQRRTFTCTSHRSLEVKGKPRIGTSGRK
ncbi:hypothetical protein K7X08_035770 [Anisodus acutangulus]|uniref:Uncharacterized protein n=1 Tax=Anisodus acutangulus TaxID=402998 RepID=A0A9Q1L734_9SOLA|nr:hypothetical protein K7X08_035770 [Anisodus acutangulus]